MNDVIELAKLRARIAALELQLTAHEQLQQLLLYTTSHDLRTPVMTVLGFTDMLLADIQDSPSNNQPGNHAGNHQSRQYLERIRGAAQRQILLIEDLQRVSHLNRQPLKIAPTDLSAVAEQYFQALPDTVKLTSLTLQIETTPPTNCDAEMTSAALQALLSNAIKLASNAATPQITFGANTQNSRTVFFVRDNGAGFDFGSDHSLLNIYRHLQAHHDSAGTGMALLTAIVIMQRHGGSLWVESMAGAGTSVYFSFNRMSSDSTVPA